MSQKIRLTPKAEVKNEDKSSSLFELRRHPNLSLQSRTRIRSFGDILNVIKEAGREGLLSSIISRKANLAHHATIEKCKELILAGLIEVKILDKKKVYVITEKGLNFFQEYGKFQSLVESLNLRY